MVRLRTGVFAGDPLLSVALGLDDLGVSLALEAVLAGGRPSVREVTRVRGCAIRDAGEGVAAVDEEGTGIRGVDALGMGIPVRVGVGVVVAAEPFV